MNLRQENGYFFFCRRSSSWQGIDIIVGTSDWLDDASWMKVYQPLKMLNVLVAIQSFWIELNHLLSSVSSCFLRYRRLSFLALVNFKHSKETSRTIPKLIPLDLGVHGRGTDENSMYGRFMLDKRIYVRLELVKLGRQQENKRYAVLMRKKEIRRYCNIHTHKKRIDKCRTISITFDSKIYTAQHHRNGWMVWD